MKNFYKKLRPLALSFKVVFLPPEWLSSFVDRGYSSKIELPSISSLLILSLALHGTLYPFSPINDLPIWTAQEMVDFPPFMKILFFQLGGFASYYIFAYVYISIFGLFLLCPYYYLRVIKGENLLLSFPQALKIMVYLFVIIEFWIFFVFILAYNCLAYCKVIGLITDSHTFISFVVAQNILLVLGILLYASLLARITNRHPIYTTGLFFTSVFTPYFIVPAMIPSWRKIIVKLIDGFSYFFGVIAWFIWIPSWGLVKIWYAKDATEKEIVGK